MLLQMFNTQLPLLFKQIKCHLRRLAFHMRLFNFFYHCIIFQCIASITSDTRLFISFQFCSIFLSYKTELSDALINFLPFKYSDI